MTFDELLLCMAIKKAGRSPDTPRTNEHRMDLAKRVMCEWLRMTEESVFPFTVDEIVNHDTRIRKNKDTQTKITVAEAHGVRCFWKGRDKGPCCENAECGHIWQNSKGGPMTVENCMIECRSHNNQRRDMSIEDYIRSDKSTEVAK